jgi:hypothetical protein
VSRPTNEYLTFTEIWPEDRKTAVVDIRSARHGDYLGVIRWYGSWRQYAFYPGHETIWNPGCLATIQDYIADLMVDRKTKPTTEREFPLYNPKDG